MKIVSMIFGIVLTICIVAFSLKSGATRFGDIVSFGVLGAVFVAEFILIGIGKYLRETDSAYLKHVENRADFEEKKNHYRTSYFYKG